MRQSMLWALAFSLPLTGWCRLADAIALPLSPTPVERYAARELKDGLERCTGRPWWLCAENETTNAAVRRRRRVTRAARRRMTSTRS